jgi:hypothetical protein
LQAETKAAQTGVSPSGTGLKLNSDGHSPPIRRYRRVSRKFLERWDWVVGHSATLEILSAPDQVHAPRDAIAFLPAAELLSRYQRKTLSPVETVDAVLDQVDRHDGVVNAWCCLDREGARRSARESEARWMAGAPRGLLDGVAVGIKDNLLVAGMPTRFGSRLTADALAAQDAPAVARLRDQGAIVIARPRCPNSAGRPSPTAR